MQNVIQVVPDSQFFSTLEQIENYLASSESRDEYLLIGIRNTIARGYVLELKPDIPKGG
jgi:hypothetical protein